MTADVRGAIDLGGGKYPVTVTRTIVTLLRHITMSSILCMCQCETIRHVMCRTGTGRMVVCVLTAFARWHNSAPRYNGSWQAKRKQSDDSRTDGGTNT